MSDRGHRSARNRHSRPLAPAELTARTRQSRTLEGGVTVYTTEPCGFCRQAKALLQSRGVPYTEINLAKDPNGRADLVAMTGQMTFPQVVIGDCSIGGFRELLEADREGSLTELLDRAA